MCVFLVVSIVADGPIITYSVSKSTTSSSDFFGYTDGFEISRRDNSKVLGDSDDRQLQVGNYLAKMNGKKLPNSVTEDIRGFSLRPLYSVKQLRSIDRRLRQRKQRALSVRGDVYNDHNN